MTDNELRDAAVAELKLTTAGWRKPNGNLNYPSGEAPATTHWGKAMDFLEQIGGAAPPPPPPPPPPTGAYMVDNFDSVNLNNWKTVPAPQDTSRLKIVPNPDGGNMASMIVMQGGEVNPSGGVMVALAKSSGGDRGQYTRPGDDTWYRVRLRFPSGLYFPTHGAWNIHVEWHTSYPPAGSWNSFMGVNCDFSANGLPGQNPRLAFDLRGGQIGTSSWQDILIEPFPSNSLLFDHWYDCVFHWIWKTSGGMFEWYVDGVKKYANMNFPTLATWPAGETDWPGFGLYNYRRWDITTTSRCDFDLAVIGPSAASVGL